MCAWQNIENKRKGEKVKGMVAEVVCKGTKHRGKGVCKGVWAAKGQRKAHARALCIYI